MRAVVQRVRNASVEVEGERISEIGKGLLVLICVVPEDTAEDLEWLAAKIAKMRIFDDAEGVMNLSVSDIKGEILCVSQFTLVASTRKGNRPSYIGAARPEQAVPMYEAFCQRLGELAATEVRKGIFGADMKVSLLNDGPVTIVIDSQLKE